MHGKSFRPHLPRAPSPHLYKIGDGLRALQCSDTAFMICMTFRQPRILLADKMVAVAEGGFEKAWLTLSEYQSLSGKFHGETRCLPFSRVSNGY